MFHVGTVYINRCCLVLRWKCCGGLSNIQLRFFVVFPLRCVCFSPQNEQSQLNVELVFVFQTVGDDGERPAASSQAAQAAEIHSERPDG